MNPIYESEQIVGITITAKNINAQKMAYQELQQKLGILDAVFNSTTDGLLLLDFDYTVVKVNDTFISLLQGLSGHELKVNENFLNIIFTEKNKSLFIQLAEKAKLGEQVENLNGRVIKIESNPKGFGDSDVPQRLLQVLQTSASKTGHASYEFI